MRWERRSSSWTSFSSPWARAWDSHEVVDLAVGRLALHYADENPDEVLAPLDDKGRDEARRGATPEDVVKVRRSAGKRPYQVARPARCGRRWRIVITADAGGSNSYRSHVWKHQLQRVADKLDMSIHVSHFPPGTSKWNKVEHRLFSFISINWCGRPPRAYETVINLIGNTTDRG